MQAWTVTCHECRSNTHFTVVRDDTPPQMFICANCKRWYQLVDVADDETVTWKLRGFLNYDFTY